MDNWYNQKKKKQPTAREMYEASGSPKANKQDRLRQAQFDYDKQKRMDSAKSKMSGNSSDSGSGDSSGGDTASKVLNYSELAGSALGLGENKTSTSDQIASNTLKYASMGGSMGGAPGMAIGAVIGGTLGAIKARQARKAARYEAEADKQEAFAKIEGEKGDRIQRAMAGLGQAFSRNLSRRLQVRL